MSEFLYRKSLEFLEHLGDAGLPLTVDPLYWLAESLREQQRYDEALEILDKCLAQIDTLKLETSTLALSYYCRAKISLEKGNKETADQNFKKAMAVFDKREHPNKLIVMHAYAKFLTDNQRQAESDQINEEIRELEKALKILTT